MGVIFQNGYDSSPYATYASGDAYPSLVFDFVNQTYAVGGSAGDAGTQPLTHARIAHSGNWLAGGTITASSTATDYFSAAPDTSLTYEKWKPSSVPATWEFDNGSAVACDYCCIGAHTMGTDGASFKVQYYDGSSWVDLCDTTAPDDDMEIMVLFNFVTAQKWRLYITGASPSIAIIKFGVALQMERPLYGGHSPLDLSRQTTMRSSKSSTGEFLGRTKLRTMLSTEFAWSNLTAAWVRENWRPFQKAIEEEPFFIAWRPDTFSEVGLCYSDNMPIPQNSGTRDLMNVSLQVNARGYD